MKDKLLQIRVDDDFMAKVQYLKTINAYKSNAETIRQTIEKEYRKEKLNEGHWEHYLNEGLKWKCSKCGSRCEIPYHYCMNCGSRMIGGAEHE